MDNLQGATNLGVLQIFTTHMPQQHWLCHCCKQQGNHILFQRCYICKHWTATHYKHKCWQAATDPVTGMQYVVCNCCIEAATYLSSKVSSNRRRQALLPLNSTLMSTQQGQEHKSAAPPHGGARASDETQVCNHTTPNKTQIWLQGEAGGSTSSWSQSASCSRGLNQVIGF